MNPIAALHEFGQSIWLDYLGRDILRSGELKRLIEAGEVRGLTSNPSIFEHAIDGSDLYMDSLRSLAKGGATEEQIFGGLTKEDILSAANLFMPLYDATNGGDGYVSLEVNPHLAYDTEGTLHEVRALWGEVNRPNLMIKIPGTKEGIPAIEQAIYEGINVNITLLFSLERHMEVMQAYLQGLERREREGESLEHIASVASFFVSRIDTKVDGRLSAYAGAQPQGAEQAKALMGKIAIASAKLAYAQFQAIFGDQRFAFLASKGARRQRVLWASTSTKNPSYPDTYYVDNLIGPYTVNTLPPHTLDAFRAHGTAELTLERNLSAARAQLEALEKIGISLGSVTQELEQEGAEKFSQSYDKVLASIRKRMQE
jgi:transaldolase